MPIYIYKCENCGQTHEIRHAVDDNASLCPECGETLRRIIKPVPFILRGKGWTKKSVKND